MAFKRFNLVTKGGFSLFLGVVNQVWSGEGWEDPQAMASLLQRGLADNGTQKQIRKHGYDIFVKTEPEFFRSWVSHLGSQDTSGGLTDLPQCFLSGLSLKPQILQLPLEVLEKGIFCPEERSRRIILANTKLLNELEPILEGKTDGKVGKFYARLSKHIEELSKRMDEGFDALQTPCCMPFVVDDASSFIVDLPLCGFLETDKTKAEDKGSVLEFDLPADYLNLIEIDQEKWSGKILYPPEAQKNFVLRVYFSTADGFPHVLKTGLFLVRDDSFSEEATPLQQVLSEAFDGQPGLINEAIIKEDIRNSILNHTLLQICLSCQQALTTMNARDHKKKGNHEAVQKQLSWVSLCSQFLINLTLRDSAIFEYLLDVGSDWCNGPLPEELLQQLMTLGDRPVTSKGGKGKKLTKKEPEGLKVVLSIAPQPYTTDEPDYESFTCGFWTPKFLKTNIPDLQTRKLMEMDNVHFMVRFGWKKSVGKYLRPSFNVYQVKPEDKDIYNSFRELYKKGGELFLKSIHSVAERYSYTNLSQGTEHIFRGFDWVKSIDESMIREYLGFIKTMAVASNQNAASVEDYILNVPVAEPAIPEETGTPSDRLLKRTVVKKMQELRAKDSTDDRVDVTAFLMRNNDELSTVLLANQIFTASKILNESHLYKTLSDKSSQEVIRRVVIMTREEPFPFAWVRMFMTPSGQRSFRGDIQMTNQIRLVVDTPMVDGHEDLSQAHIVTAFPELPRGAWPSFSNLLGQEDEHDEATE